MPEKGYVNKEVVINYFNGLPPAKQMFVMNYDTRKNFIENEKNKVAVDTNIEVDLNTESN
jgi:hypothetical protein